MIPTTRLFFLLLVPALPLAAAGTLLPAGAVAAAAAGVALFAATCAAAADWLLAADLRRVSVRREVAAKLSLGEWNPVRLVARSGASRSIALSIRDVTPPGMAVDPPLAARLRGTVPAGGETVLLYRLRPPQRGDYAFGDLYLRAPGPLGLVVRQRRLPGTAEAVRVYPSLRQLRRYDLVVRRGAALEAGSRVMRSPGGGTEFERLREYLPDDEFRRINWKATARRGTPIVNQLEAERSQNLVILLDAGRLMGAPAISSQFSVLSSQASEAVLAGEAPTGLAKLDYAVNTALLLAYVASQRDDRLALLAYADRIRAFLPPARGRRGLLRVLQALYNLEPEPVEPDHGLAWQYLAGRNLRRSLVVLFTDLADRESSATLVAHLVRAARSHQAVCVTLRDPAVVEPASRRPQRIEDLYEQMVAQRLLDERAAVLATLRHRGVLALDTDADTLSPQVITTYLDLKRRGRV